VPNTAIFCHLNPVDYRTIRSSGIPISAANGFQTSDTNLGSYIATYVSEVGAILKRLDWVNIKILTNTTDCIMLMCDESRIEPSVVDPTKKRRIKNCP
jgi:hypothetical protein